MAFFGGGAQREDAPVAVQVQAAQETRVALLLVAFRTLEVRVDALALLVQVLDFFEELDKGW